MGFLAFYHETLLPSLRRGAGPAQSNHRRPVHSDPAGFALDHPGSLRATNYHSDKHLCYPGRELGPSFRFHGSDEFRPCPFLWRRGLKLGHPEYPSAYSALGQRTSGGSGRGTCRAGRRHPLLRFKHTYLALTTLAFPIILLGIVFALPDLTGGELGISGLNASTNFLLGDYYIHGGYSCSSCVRHVENYGSNTGIIFHAIREDELAVKASGINTTRYKLLAFCLSGLFCRPGRRTLRPFHADRRPVHPGVPCPSPW